MQVLQMVVLVAAVALAFPATAAPPSVALQVFLHCRDLAPGEPVRVEVLSAVRLETVSGRFLGAPVFFVRDTSRGTADHWSGWSAVELDRAPGLAVVEVQGRTAAGGEALGTLAVRVHPRTFPREELSVDPRFVEPPPEARPRIERERARLNRIFATARECPPPEATFVRPVPGDPTSVFGTRRIFNGKPRDPHPGLDLRAPPGTPVCAAGPGRVVLAADLYYAGNTVILDHGGELFTIYGHLSAIQVRRGQEVKAGDVLGLSGQTGRVTGPHLHWGARIGQRIFDPSALLDPALWGRQP